MSLYNVFNIAGSGMSAQNVRLNTIASNISNADSISSSYGETYRARKPVFAAVQQSIGGKLEPTGVQVKGIVESKEPLNMRYEPNHPMADEKGYIYMPNVNIVEEMTDMISASRSYQTNVQIASTAKKLLEKTLTLGS
jgi:flagellar basal-body rod protein FlgC